MLDTRPELRTGEEMQCTLSVQGVERLFDRCAVLAPNFEVFWSRCVRVALAIGGC